MRIPRSSHFLRLIPVLTAIVLLGAAALLGLRPEPDFARRDAFVVSLERGERQLGPRHMAREWRSELTAQQALLRQDRWVGAVLAGVGVLALIGAWSTGRQGQAQFAA